MSRRFVHACVVAAVLLGSVSDAATAQIPSLRKVKEAAKKASQAKDSVAKVIDKVNGTTTEAKATAAKLDPRAWDDYDFIPGNKVLFTTDFSEDRTGTFPSRLRHRRGSIDVVERNGTRMLRATAKSEFLVPVGTMLPERFTLEIDVIAPAEYCCLDGVIFVEGGNIVDQGRYSADISWAPHGAWVNGSEKNRATTLVPVPEQLQPGLRGRPVQLRASIDGTNLTLYANERRLLNLPEIEFKRDVDLRVVLHGADTPGMAAYITAIRVSERSVESIRDLLNTAGRWSTLGFLFAQGKPELREESTPVVREIATTLKENPDLRVRIEVHTDNTGDAAANLALSQQRATAIRDALVTRFGTAADRVEARGMGDTQPVASNDTPEGRSQNRRVEVVRP